MFSDCDGLTSLDFSNWKTDSLLTMEGMFEVSTNLTTITFGPNWNTSGVTDMSDMFNGCNNLTTITFGPKWDISKNNWHMFTGCCSLQSMPNASKDLINKANEDISTCSPVPASITPSAVTPLPPSKDSFIQKNMILIIVVGVLLVILLLLGLSRLMKKK
jgi:surface protein